MIKNNFYKFYIALTFFLFSSFNAFCVGDIQKGKETTLENGLIIVTYTIDKQVPISVNLPVSTVPVKYVVEWPVSGSPILIDPIQKWILDYVTIVDDNKINYSVP